MTLDTAYFFSSQFNLKLEFAGVPKIPIFADEKCVNSIIMQINE